MAIASATEPNPPLGSRRYIMGNTHRCKRRNASAWAEPRTSSFQYVSQIRSQLMRIDKTLSKS